MSFRFYSNMMSQASRSIAAGIFIVGMLLIGFGVLIIALPQLFALLAATVFFIAGLSAIIFAIKIFWTSRYIDKMNRDDDDSGGRVNVRIHREDE